MRVWFRNIGISLSQLLHSVLGGNPDITLSAATYLRARNGSSQLNTYLKWAIDVIFFWEENHCKNAYERDLENAKITVKTLKSKSNK